MFTGIVEEVGSVRSAGAGKLVVSAARVVDGTAAGDSISVNGACLTVTESGPGWFAVDVMAETLKRTNLGSLKREDRVNLERAVAAGGRFGGHFVQGHVDGTGRIASMLPAGDSVLMTVDVAGGLARYIVEKGFIAVDGVSLTIVESGATWFTVSLVGYTRESTTFAFRQRGDVVNLEVDIIAKYVERFRSGERSGITPEFLEEHGFLAS